VNAGIARRVVAIDGPAASGKSTVARAVAQRIQFDYLNSGAMYRAVTWHVLQKGIDPDDEAGVAKLLDTTQIDCEHRSTGAEIFINGINPAEHLRDDRVNQTVSAVSRNPHVREILVAKMRAYAGDRDVVVEGRDIGSVVFPTTPFKYYIDASLEVRAQRRKAEGQRDQIAFRDSADSSRTIAPLLIAPDAFLIDSSNLTIEEVVGKVISRLEKRGLTINPVQVT
jgi:CMP/dCMP kinase